MTCATPPAADLAHNIICGATSYHARLRHFRLWDSGLPARSGGRYSGEPTVAVDGAPRSELPATAARSAAAVSSTCTTGLAGRRTNWDDWEVHFTVRDRRSAAIRFRDARGWPSVHRTHYRRYAGQRRVPLPLPVVPDDYDRTRCGASDVGYDSRKRALPAKSARRKAVVYQWESRKRTPSPVFWKRVDALGGARRTACSTSSIVPERPLP